MTTENQAGSPASGIGTSEQTKAAPKAKKTFDPRASVIQIHPEGERIHPKKAKTVRQTAYRRRIGDAVCVLRHSVVQLERQAGRRFQYPRTAFLHFRIVVGGGRFDLPCLAADDLRLRAVLVDDDCRATVVRLFLPANGLHRNYAVD